MRGKVLAASALLLAFILVVGIAGLQANLSKGDKSPDFTLPKLDGKEVKLSDLQQNPNKKGEKQVVVLDFWATWCPPCRDETPHLQKLHEKYGKKGLVVVGVAQDSDGAKSVKPFVEKNKLTYVQLIDSKHEVARKYKVGPIPTTYIIDRKGVIRVVQLGFAPGMEKDMEEEIEALLK